MVRKLVTTQLGSIFSQKAVNFVLQTGDENKCKSLSIILDNHNSIKLNEPKVRKLRKKCFLID